MNEKSNTNFTDYILGLNASIKNKVFWFRIYLKTCKNFFEISRSISQNKFPLKMKMKNGKVIEVNSKDEASLFALIESYSNLKYDEKNDLLQIDFDNKYNKEYTKLFGIKKSIDAILTFNHKNPYHEINVRGKTIIDIGGAIGDTSIFFIKNGAEKIICLEPFPKNFELAKKNIIQNNLKQKIELILGACFNKSGKIAIDPNSDSSMRSELVESESTFTIPTFTIEQLIRENRIQNAILKMDCEGCEYETILNSSVETLQKFSYIIIEFHNGFRNLKEKLQKSDLIITKIVRESKQTGYIIAKNSKII